MKTRCPKRSVLTRQTRMHVLLRTAKRIGPALIGCVLLCILSCFRSAAAEPSGGSYGPIRQTYELPKDAKTIYYVAPDGKEEASGKTLDEPTVLEAAIKKVVTGDAIILRGGTYRVGDLHLNQGTTIQPYRDEQPIVKGTFVAKDWQRQENGLWKTSWDRLFPAEPADWWRPSSFGRTTPLHRFNNDMVFVDGRFLQSAGSQEEVDENSYYIDYETKEVFIRINPNDKLIEITAFDSFLTREIDECHGKKSDGKGSAIRGILFMQYAFRAFEILGADPQGLSLESEHGKDVVGMILENCTISYCSRVAGYFKGDNFVLRNCLISDTGTEGIYVISSNDILLEKNIFRRNNIENISGYFPAAVKIFNQCYRAACRDNLVIDHPNSNGIWYDVGNVDGRFINNRIERVGRFGGGNGSGRSRPSEAGFFFEISKGAICAGNVFIDCDHGIHILNSCDVQICQNTFVNSDTRIARNGRSAVGDHFGWHPSTGPDVDKRDGHVFVNNLLVAKEDFVRPLLDFSQPESLCDQLTKPQVKQFDHNVYVYIAKPAGPFLLWSPADHERCKLEFDSLEDFRKRYPEFETASLYLANYNGPLFQDLQQGNVHCIEDFEGFKATGKLPTEVGKLLGLSEKEPSYVGAYPLP